MFCVSYKCFSVLCDAFLQKGVISSHNSCDKISKQIETQPKSDKKFEWHNLLFCKILR